jgi:hypothetical protein
MNDLKVFVVTHKPVIYPDDPAYECIQAGAALHRNFTALRDDSGDNISIKNKYYSELTAHYWIWKNVTADYIGLVHYRRHFAPVDGRILHLGKWIASGEDLSAGLHPNKVIIAKPFYFHYDGSSRPQSLEQQYFAIHGFELVHARRAVAEVDSSYLPTFDFVMRNNCLYAFNLCVASKGKLDNYFSWVFKVLLLVEGLVNLKSLDGYAARVAAFLSERLFTVWLVHNQGDLAIETRPHVYFAGV